MFPVAADPFQVSWETAAKAFEPQPDYTNDPALWVKDKLGEHLWSKQVEICQSVVENRYTAVQSCHDAGKSYIASRIAAWWISSHPPGEAFVVSTAPTAAQVYAILWREITKAHSKGRLLGRIVSSGYPQWKLDSGELVGYGRKPADYEDSAFQGIHARYVLIIMDEACGIDRNLFDAVDSLATNEQARVLAIGNPDDPSSHFRQVCQPDSGWNTIRIDGLRTPNITEAALADFPLLRALMDEEGIAASTEAIPEDLRPMLISPLWIEERLQRWVNSKTDQPISSSASQSALFTAKVRGLFPEDNSSGVIPLGWVERAIDRHNDWRRTRHRLDQLPGRRVVGVDVAREGEDQTCLAIRQGWAVDRLERYTGIDTMETVTKVENWLDVPHALAVVDVIGVGGGVVDRLRQLNHDVIAFNASANSSRTDVNGEFTFRNDRSAAWWRMRELLDPTRGSQVMLPDDDQLRVDLTAPRWTNYAGAKIGVDSKDDIRKRIGRSPDTGDAVIQAFWVDSNPVGGLGAAGAVDWGSDDESFDDGAIPWT